MKKEIPVQLIFAAAVLVIGAAFLGIEYFLVRWYPKHQQRINEETLKPVPYSNPELGVDVQVAAGIYGKVETFAGGAKIFRDKLFGVGPSLTITSQPNPDKSTEFSPQSLAQWQTDGVYHQVPRYRFEHTQINHRDAVLIWQLKNHYMQVTARVISPDHIVEATCTPGQEDENLYLEACDTTLHALKVAGPEPPAQPAEGVLDLTKRKKR